MFQSVDWFRLHSGLTMMIFRCQCGQDGRLQLSFFFCLFFFSTSTPGITWRISLAYALIRVIIMGAFKRKLIQCAKSKNFCWVISNWKQKVPSSKKNGECCHEKLIFSLTKWVLSKFDCTTYEWITCCVISFMMSTPCYIFHQSKYICAYFFPGELRTRSWKNSYN